MASSAPYLSHEDLRAELTQLHGQRHRSLNTAFYGRGEVGDVPIPVEHQVLAFRVVPVSCELQLRRALAGAELAGSTVALLVDYEDRLPLDLQGRLAGGHLQFISRERRLANLFGVQRVAPTLVEGALSEALLHAGWTYALSRSATTIDLLTAWRAFLAKTVGLAIDDALTEEGVVEFFASRPPAAADPLLAKLLECVEGLNAAIEAFLTSTVGPVARLSWRNWRSGKATDIAAMSFVLDALSSSFDEGAVKVFVSLRLRDLGVAFEGKGNGASVLVNRWARMAPALYLRLGDQVPEILRRADRILEESSLSEVVRHSRFLTAGFNGLKGELQSLMVAALQRNKRDGVPVVNRSDIATVHEVYKKIETHHLYRDAGNKSLVDRTLMGLRLLAYLSVRPDWSALLRDSGPVEPLFRLAEGFAREGGFVDLARSRVRGGDDALDAAIGQVVNVVDAHRDDMDRRFVKALALWNDDRRAGRVLPIEDALSEIAVSFLKDGDRRRLLILLMDGMSWASAAELILDVSAVGYSPLRWQPSKAQPGSVLPMIAALPTMTEVSRAALFAGKLVQPGEALSTLRDPERLRDHKGFVKAFGEGPTLLLRTDAESQTGHLTEAARKLVASSDRVVGVVVNAVDDQLTSKPGYHVEANRRTIKALEPLLSLARETGRAVLLIGDHGHVTSSRPHTTVEAKGSENPRYREMDEAALLSSTASDREIIVGGTNAYVSRKSRKLAMLFQETDRYASQRHIGEHGGASLAEVVTPALMLATPDLRQEIGEDGEALDVVAYPIPAWWHLDVPVEKAVVTETPKMPSKPTGKPKPPEAQLKLLPDPPPTPPVASPKPPASPWRARLLEVFIGLDKPRKHDLEKRVIPAVELLVEHGGHLAEDVFAGHLGEASRNVGGRVALIAELLNEDGYQVIAHDVLGKQVRLDLDLLKDLFAK